MTVRIAVPVVLGLVLGLAAYTPELVDESAAPYVNPLVSSGFAFGLVALLAGYLMRQRKTAILAGGTALTLAIVIYYCLILFVNQRWYADALSTGDGLASSAGLASVGRSTAFWVAGSMIGGGLMGWLGWTIRQSPLRRSSAALGLSLGLLTGEAVATPLFYHTVHFGPWSAFDLSKLVPALTQIVLALIAVGCIGVFGKQPVLWRIAGAAAAASVTLGTLCWLVLLTIRMEL